MTKKGKSSKTKRSAVPSFWRVPRKVARFSVTTASGPHPRSSSYPLAVFLRDIIKLVKNYKEAEVAIKEGKIIVDGIVRKSPNFPLGLMDIVEIPAIGRTFRLMPLADNPLFPVEISESEKLLKLCKIERKTTVKGGHVQLGLHDGRSIILNDATSMKPGDSCLIEVPSQKIINTVGLAKGTLVVVTRGEKVGKFGKVEEIKSGTFSSPKMVRVLMEGVPIELMEDMVVAIGEEKPLIKIGGGA